MAAAATTRLRVDFLGDDAWNCTHRPAIGATPVGGPLANIETLMDGHGKGGAGVPSFPLARQLRPLAAAVALALGGAVEDEPHVDVVGQHQRLDAAA